MILADNPAVGGTDGMGKIFGGKTGVIFGKKLVKITTLVSAVFGDFPFVPDMNATIL